MSRLKAFEKQNNTKGVYTGLAGFFVDNVVDDVLEANYSKLEKKVSSIAKTAQRNINSIYSSDLNYQDNVPVASAVFFAQIRNYVKNVNSQISDLRLYVAGELDRLVATQYVAPVTISRDTLAAIGGAEIDPKTNSAVRTEDGSYIVEGIIGAGLLYTGVKSIELLKQDYFDKNGVLPELEYTWLHTTPLNRALIEHAYLQGRKFTNKTAPIVLRNTTVPWLGPFFTVGDHFGCRCFLSVGVKTP